MKFGKEYLSQMLPEWKDAYLDYTYLKTLLKDVLNFKRKEQEKKGQTQQKSLVRDLTFYRSFSGLHKRKSHDFNNPHGGGDIEDQFIVVKAVKGANSNVKYETKFAEDATDQEVVFFNTLDYEFSKVDEFYKDKVEEVMNKVALLNKQMDALIALRIKVENPNLDMSGAVRELVADVASLADTSNVSNPSTPRMPRKEQMFVIQETGIADEEDSEGSNGGVDVDKSNGGNNNFKPAPLEILEHVKISNEPETPKSTIKAMLLKDSKDKKLEFNRKQLKKVEEQLKQVFIEFHWKLRTYGHQNHTYGQWITLTLAALMSILCASVTSQITAVLERVEATFVKHFCDSNRRNGMKSLRPTAKKAKHKTTFFLGYFAGCTTALLVALVLVINARKLVNKEGRIQYMENIFPLYRQVKTSVAFFSLFLLQFFRVFSLVCIFSYGISAFPCLTEFCISFYFSLFAFIILHMLMYAVNIYFWRCYRVNYPFIFGFKQGNELGYREVFLLSAGLTLLSLAGVLANLDMEMDPGTQSYQTVTELVPLGLVTLVHAIEFAPSTLFIVLVVFSLSNQYGAVTLIDFFLADQLTSQVQAFRSLVFYICYYGWGEFTQRQNNCRQSATYNSFYFIVAVLPYWSRLLQCLRRWVEEKDVSQVYNGLKYLLTIIAVLMRTGFDLEKGTSRRAVAIISSAIAAIMSTYWDIVKDWGLLQRHSKNPCVYFIAMVLDVILRLAWLRSVVNFHVTFLHRTALTTIVACLEILRRGMWNFFRLENEQLNNVGKFRAFKSVPLPFSYYDEDSSKDD
ncbi:hypothetical protein C5167_043528 [Papaver somniferum]|uniref:SPX domain-containing protein n=1 Tax=Papaver somniferum TaxID=3469 RepID=A0A4Y7L608_PAPSO|nr:hypothetical protein C5167_043528 [Papaver somniferum]